MPLVFDVETGVLVEVLVTIADYRRLTGDTTTSDSSVEEALLTAQRLVEEWLRRELSEKERTETLTLYSCKVYPSVTPIASTVSGTISGTAITPDVSITSESWFGGIPQEDGTVDITYIGGFTEDTLPRTLQLAIIRTAKSLLSDSLGDGSPSELLTGASEVSVGDVRVKYGSSSSSSTPTVTASSFGIPADVKDSIKRYRRQWV